MKMKYSYILLGSKSKHGQFVLDTIISLPILDCFQPYKKEISMISTNSPFKITF